MRATEGAKARLANRPYVIAKLDGRYVTNMRHRAANTDCNASDGTDFMKVLRWLIKVDSQ